ncbi:MAG: tol-pal system protein YbgF [Proteobacteria bacterium]|nr:tol-pal system protein YbgF [Pseudomonadota bacterium]MBU1389430.1 tol-pal system protein YbgF [Pseudomonadota bacterium]MBU1541250.1 tol-pal system protein YbgF [Pseudomonadota bacterium]MBU2429313.1 tol-pal system protein YbgF [Pseudomonadota bacterium]MBU2482442.1 tol-pal system protein YbgF [Pseudomonadota bacterium]
MKKISLLCLFFVCLFVSGCVESNQMIALENRLAAIEMENNRQLGRKNDQTQLNYQKEIEKIQKRLNQGHLLSKEEYAEIKYEIQSIKSDIQRLDGLIQELKHIFEQYTQTDRQGIEKSFGVLDNAISRNYEKIIKLEKYMGFEPVVGNVSEQTPEISALPEKDAQQQLYDLAKKMFDDGDKENARIQFENFINKYPKSENADNARFWIADSYYTEKWFEKAILEYQKVLEEYPDSNKLAAARLKQGYAFAELGENANARLILKELIKKHPDSNEAKYAQEKLKNLK